MKIYCINTIEREDRYLKMKEQFDNYNIDVTFIRNKKHEKGGLYGCFEAHIMCITDALSNDLDYCLILEDDNSILDTYRDSIFIAEDFFLKNADAEIIYLQNRGLLCAYEHNSEYMYKCVSYGTSCYMLNKKGMNNIINEYKSYIDNNIHYDQCLMKLTHNNAYCCTKYITTGYLSQTDNDYNYVKRKIIPYINIYEPYINAVVLAITVPLMKYNIFKQFYLNCVLYENIWHSYFKNVDNNKYTIYIHYKNNKPLAFFEKYKLNKCINTKYADISLVKAQNVLLDTALTDMNNEHFVFLSGSCIPFKNFSTLYDTLDCNNSYFTTYSKIDCYPRCIPLLFYTNYKFMNKASQGCILNRKHAQSMTHDTKYLTYYNYIYAPDDHAYITNIHSNNLQNEIITSNKPLDQTTFVSWDHKNRYKYKYIELYNNSKNESLLYLFNLFYLCVNFLCWCLCIPSSNPYDYTSVSKDELASLCKSKCYFGRKFNTKCNNVLTSDSDYIKYITM